MQKHFRLMGSLFYTLFTLSALLFANQVVAQDWNRIRERAKDAIIFIETKIQNLDGTNPEQYTSTGFILSTDGYVITAAHAVPQKPDTITSYSASIRTRKSNNKYKLELIKREDDLDIALLRLPDAKNWDVLSISDSSNLRDEDRLYVLGFPLTADLSSADGRLSNRFGPGGKWQTTIPLNYGNSGGPVFNVNGQVVGIAAGGIDQAQGITYVIPSRYAANILEIAGIQITNNISPGHTRPPEDISNRISFRIDEILDIHESFTSETTRNYERIFEATPGFTIRSIDIIRNSATRVNNLRHEIIDGGKKVVIRFELSSGPQIDRYRGWLHADVIVVQERL